MKNKSFSHRLRFALAGLAEAWQRENSFRTQVLMAGVAFVVVVLLRPGLFWTALVVVAIALVLALELANSAIEYMIDHLHPDIAPEIKRAKDVAAAAVLVVSLGAVAVGALMVASVVWR